MGENPANRCRAIADYDYDRFYRDDEIEVDGIEDGDDRPLMSLAEWEQQQRDIMAAACDEVKKIVTGSRNKCYGAPFDNHICTADMWTAYLRRRGLLAPGAALDAVDVCDLMDMLKFSRNAHWRQRDNLVDAMGYAANALACAWAMENPKPE